MEKVNIHNAKTHLSKLIEKVLDGEEVVIAKSGRPLVRMVPYRPVKKRTPGSWKGKIGIAPDFDELPEGIKNSFGGE